MLTAVRNLKSVAHEDGRILQVPRKHWSAISLDGELATIRVILLSVPRATVPAYPVDDETNGYQDA